MWSIERRQLFSDLEGPLTWFSRSRHSLTPNISQTTDKGSTAALGIPPQDSGQIEDTMTPDDRMDWADDRMDVAQSSSFSEAATSEEETVDEDTLLRSPLEQETETGTAPSCSAEVSTGGVATGQKRKTEGGPTPPQAIRNIKKTQAWAHTWCYF